MKGIYWLGLGITSFVAFTINPCFAQSSNIVPDDSLGVERSGVVPLDSDGLAIDAIDGGAIRGANLFHSFTEFNVAELRGAYFRNPSNDIQNILARVTGNNRSEILGTLGIFNGFNVTSNPNLYLINPSGIVFGENASLDLGGSFVATTANGISLGETGFFSATEPLKSNLLSINPSALFFNAVNTQAEIVNRSKATNTALGFSLNSDINRQISGLQVLDGKSLLLVGGNVNLERGNLIAPSGRIELGSVSGVGSVNINQTEKGLALGYENINNFGDIKLSTLAFVSGSGESGGDIQIQAKQLLLDFGSIIATRANSSNYGGEIFIRTTDSVIVDDSTIGSVLNQADGTIGNVNIETKKFDVRGGFFPYGGLISTITTGESKAGDINIKAETVNLTNGGEISASTNAGGNAGNITINASESVEVIGENKNDFSSFAGLLSIPENPLSKIATQVNTNASGSGGKLSINTKRLTVKDGAQIQAGTFSRVTTGKGGILNVNASESVEISGTDGDGSASGLFTATYGGADANDLNINTGKLTILNGGIVSASTAGLLGEGKGGNINIQVNSAFLEDASISSNSGIEQINPERKLGDAGDILINARDNIQANNSQISTTATQSSGGAIAIMAKNMRFAHSDIRTNVFSGAGGGGNITLTANTIIALDDSDILSFASDGKGGDIKFNTIGFFSKPLYNSNSPATDANADTLNNNNQVDVNASGTVSGAIVGVPDVTFIDEDLTDLPDNQIDTNSLIANSCISRSTKRQENSFKITGSGGLRNSPGDEFISIYSTGDVRNIKPTRAWKKGDSIIEPTAVYKLSDAILLSRECS